MRVNSGKGSGRSHGMIRTNWKRQLVRYGEKTAVVGQIYGSMLDLLKVSAGANNGQEIADWLGFHASARFIRLEMHPTGLASAGSGPINFIPTYYVSTNPCAGFMLVGLSEASCATDVIAWDKLQFDWEMIVVSV